MLIERVIFIVIRAKAGIVLFILCVSVYAVVHMLYAE